MIPLYPSDPIVSMCAYALGLPARFAHQVWSGIQIGLSLSGIGRDAKAAPQADTMEGIERLRRAVNLFNNCREGFNQEFTAPQLLAIHDAYVRCGWDITPDEWSDAQVEAALRGVAPNFDE